MAIGQKSKVERITLLEPAFELGGRPHHVPIKVVFRTKMGPFDDVLMVDAHWGNDMAKIKAQAKQALADLVRLVKKGVRFIAGDFNMQTYGIAAKLRKEEGGVSHPGFSCGNKTVG